MGWVLRLVETGTDNPVRDVDVMEIARPGTLADIANLGLTLPEAKQLLARVQQIVVAAQATAMRFRGLPAPLAAVDVTSRTGGFTRLRRYSARLRYGYRGFAAPAVVIVRLLSAGHRIAGRHRSWTSCGRIFLP